ncbi:MAG: hypothetical protein RBS86_04695 [Candidatus Moranbacteria bacterium]|jgi:hypothetical protein|nr:hypothetical protein [Candidatus Moranbacteria bacterium]
MLKILKILLPLSIIAALVFYAYPIIRDRYFQDAGKSTIEIQNEDPSGTPPMYADQDEANLEPPTLEESLSGGMDQDAGTPSEDSGILNLNDRGTPDTENLAHITTEHCTSNCDAFAIDLELLEYCQQVCGLAPVKEVSNCDGKSGIEKDYCLKDLAIGKKDSKLCDPIKDANIKQTCQNRILEDLIESQQPSEEPKY